MPPFLKLLSMILFVLSGFTTAYSVIGMIGDSKALFGINEAMAGAGVIWLLLSGALWLVADIAENVRAMKEKDLGKS